MITRSPNDLGVSLPKQLQGVLNIGESVANVAAMISQSSPDSGRRSLTPRAKVVVDTVVLSLFYTSYMGYIKCSNLVT
jgi:hypothetical protein